MKGTITFQMCNESITFTVHQEIFKKVFADLSKNMDSRQDKI